MLILGVILLLLGFALGIHLLWIAGVVLAVIGLILLLLFQTGTYGSRRLY